jgi:hypothetical protein
MASETAKAKSLIMKWFDGSGQPAEMRGKLSTGVDRFLTEITARATWSETITVLLGDNSAPSFRAFGKNWHAIRCREGLAVSTVVPGWGFGWSTTFKDEYVYDVLSWLGHYARQYVHRAYVAKVLMIAWERDGVVLHPFGSEVSSMRYGAARAPTPSKKALASAAEQIKTRWGGTESTSCSKSRWRHRNTLEPAIHQAVFHFLRAHNLKSAGFKLESLIAFDCVLQSLQVIRWNGAVGDPRRNRADLVATLGRPSTEGSVAERIYFLRNEFVAHAGGWRWWDTSEYVDDDFMEEASDLALRILRCAADAEPGVRRIDPEPNDWGEWLLNSFSHVVPAIWFPAKSE